MKGLTIKHRVHFGRSRNSRKTIAKGSLPEIPTGRTPRVSKLMALAIRFDKLIREGEITDQAELARLGQVSRARVTQIMNMLLLAPDIQEEILYLPRTQSGRDPIREVMIRPIAGQLSWKTQRRMWRELLTRMSG